MSKIFFVRSSATLAGASALALCMPLRTLPQEVSGPRVNLNIPVPELLRIFAEGHREPPYENSAEMIITYSFLWQHQEPVPAPRRDSVIAGLEQLARTGEITDLRVNATGVLARAGDTLARKPREDMVAMLRGIYEANKDPRVRKAVLNAMPSQAERKEAAAFLGDILQKPSDRLAFSTEARDAIGPLLQLGDVGRDVLRRVYRAGTVKDPEARRVLEQFAKQDFRVRPPR